MPYATNASLPDAVKDALPAQAQGIWRNTFNSQEKRGLSEQRCFQSAWAAVSNAGGLGSVGTFLRPAEDLPRQLARLRELTSRPFAVNHLVPALDESAFAHTLAAMI